MLQHAAHAHAQAAVAAAQEGQPPAPAPRLSGDWYKIGVQLVRRDSEDDATARARISAASASEQRPRSAARGQARVSAARSAAGAVPLRVDVAAVEADSAAEAAALRSALSRPRASQTGARGASPAASPTPVGTPRRSAAAWQHEHDGEMAPLALAAQRQQQHPPLQPRRYGVSPPRRVPAGASAYDGGESVRHSYAGAAAMLNGGGSFVTDGHAARRTMSPGRYADRLASREGPGHTTVRPLVFLFRARLRLN